MVRTFIFGAFRFGSNLRHQGAGVHRLLFITGIGRFLTFGYDCYRASADVKTLALARAAELQRKAGELEEMRRSSEHLASNCQGDDRPACPVLSSVAGEHGGTLASGARFPEKTSRGARA